LEKQAALPVKPGLIPASVLIVNLRFHDFALWRQFGLQFFPFFHSSPQLQCWQPHVGSGFSLRLIKMPST
jgi:hypothetical protein